MSPWRAGQNRPKASAQEGCGRFVARSCGSVMEAPRDLCPLEPKANRENSRATGRLLCLPRSENSPPTARNGGTTKQVLARCDRLRLAEDL